jgi:integrase/recombinase XerD
MGRSPGSCDFAARPQTGLRVSELINLNCRDVILGTGAHIRCEGKGRKRRSTPLRRNTVKTIEAWLKERAGSDDDPVFPTIRGAQLSRDAVEHIVRKYTLAASKACTSLIGKRVSPHVLRHSTAMDLLQNGVDRTVIALWLGHESVETTQIYMHADMRLKEKALARVASTNARPGRYRPDDALLSFLNRSDYAEWQRRFARVFARESRSARHNTWFGIMAKLVTERGIVGFCRRAGLGADESFA